MSDFTSEELNLIGKSLEPLCLVAGSRNIIDGLRKKVASMYVDSLAAGAPEICLVVNRHYMIDLETHEWHGKRVKLHRLETDTGLGRIRTWVVNNSLVVTEIPSSSLMECTG